MKRFAFLFGIGCGAFAAGLGLDLILRDNFATSEVGESSRSALAEITDRETSTTEAAVHPELLGELRRLERLASGRAFAGLGTDGYPDALVAAGEDNDIVTIQSLFHDWVARDREGMLRCFLRFGQVEIPASGLNWTLDAYMIRALVDENPREAVNAVLRFPIDTGYLASVLRLMGETNPELAAELALENLGALRLSENPFLGAKVDGHLWRALAERRHFGDDERRMLGRLIRFSHDRAKLDSWISLSPSARERTSGIFMIWKDDGSMEAGELCTAILRQLETGAGNDGALLDRFFVVFASRMIESRGLEGALSWVALNVRPGDRAFALDDLFLAAEERGLPRDQVLVAFEALPQGVAKDGAAKALARTLVEDDPLAAVAWALRLPPDNAAAEAIANIALEWSQRALEDATVMALRMPAGFHLDAFLDGLARSKVTRGGNEALNWALGLPEDRARAAAIRVAEAWGEREPKEAYEAILGMIGMAYRDDLFKAVVAGRLNDDSIATEWLTGLTPKDVELARQAIRESDLDATARERALEVLAGSGSW